MELLQTLLGYLLPFLPNLSLLKVFSQAGVRSGSGSESMEQLLRSITALAQQGSAPEATNPLSTLGEPAVNLDLYSQE